MIDSNQHSDSNQRPLFKSASTDFIISKSQSDVKVFSNRHPFQILRSMADLLVRVRAYVSDVIGPRFEKKGHISEVQMSGFENWMSIRGWMSIWVLHIYCIYLIIPTIMMILYVSFPYRVKILPQRYYYFPSRIVLFHSSKAIF